MPGLLSRQCLVPGSSQWLFRHQNETHLVEPSDLHDASKVRRVDDTLHAESRGGALDIEHADPVVPSPVGRESEAYNTVTPPPAQPGYRK